MYTKVDETGVVAETDINKYEWGKYVISKAVIQFMEYGGPTNKVIL